MCVCVCAHAYVSLLPLSRVGWDNRSIFKRSKAGLNQEFPSP